MKVSIIFHVLLIAVDWFRRHGNADDRLKAYYYQGRIYQNAGNNESAMKSFVKAEQYADDADDLVAEGMLYKAMSVVYHNIFDTETAEKYNNKAMACYKEALEDFEVYSDLSDSLSLVIAEQDTGFIKERYEKELQVERAKNTRNVIIMISIVVLLFIWKIVYDLRSKLKSKNNEISTFRAKKSEYTLKRKGTTTKAAESGRNSDWENTTPTWAYTSGKSSTMEYEILSHGYCFGNGLFVGGVQACISTDGAST